MTEGFELVGTLTMRTDDKGYLDIVTHIDKTSNSSAPSNRDFYFEVAYKENPDILVAASNTLTIRHLVPGNAKLVLTTNKTAVVNNDFSILTVVGTDFTKNSSINLNLFRQIDSDLASKIETKNVVSDENGGFTLEIHHNYGNGAIIPSTRTFYTEASYVNTPDTIITSNTVDVDHTELIRNFKILMRDPGQEEVTYFDYSEKYSPPDIELPLSILVDYWNNDPLPVFEDLVTQTYGFRIEELDKGFPVNTDGLDIRWAFSFRLEDPNRTWSSYHYNWEGFLETPPIDGKDFMDAPSNWETEKHKYFMVNGYPVEMAKNDSWVLHNWAAILTVKLYVDDELVDTEDIRFVSPYYVPA